MPTTAFDQRPTGIRVAGELLWGSHFCVFYTSEHELSDVIVPFVKAGLEGNEACVWEICAPFTVDKAMSVLREEVPDLARYVALGQLQIVPPFVTGGDALERRLDQAILSGFDGLRLLCNAGIVGKEGWARAAVAETIRRLNIVAAVLYPRVELGALDLMRIVHDHCFALVCNSGQWEVLEGSEAKNTTRGALRRSEEKLESLFSNMSEGFAYHRIVLDAERKPCDFIFLEVSKAFVRLTGLVAERILGKRVTQIFPGSATDWIGRCGRVALTGEPAQFETYVAESEKWFAVSAFSPHKGYFAVTMADITDRVRAEAQRRAAEERLLVTLRSIGDAVIVTDPEGRVTLMNRVAENLTGWTEAEAMGRPLREVFQIVNEDSGAVAADPVRKVIEENCIVGLANHTALITKDGRRIAIADSAAPVYGCTALLGVVLVFRDVTDARQAERDHELTIEFLRLVSAHSRMADLAKVAVTFFQERSGCEAVGIRFKVADDFPYFQAQGFSDEFLLDENELCARDETGSVLRDSAGDPIIECICGDVICGRIDPEKPYFTEAGSFWTNDTTAFLTATKEAEQQVLRRYRCKGEGYDSVALIPLCMGGERVGLLQLNGRRKGLFSREAMSLWERLAGHLAVALARSRAEDELSRANQRLEALAEKLKSANSALVERDRRKNEFLAALSHELRNPLAPIKSSLFILEKAAPGSEQAGRAQAVIHSQVGQLNHLVDDLLDVTRISCNKIQLQRQRLELNQLVQRTVEDHRSLFDRSEVGLDFTPASTPLLINADWNRLAQIVGNLLTNACKFTDRGGKVSVSIAQDAIAMCAILRVVDNGVGMTPEMLAQLFQPFTQAETTLDRSKGGLGLGLALVKGLVELHGGDIKASSSGLGKGAELTIRLPLEAMETEEERPGQVSLTRCKGRRVLIIEDNIDAADSLREALEFGEHEVAVAYSGPEGLVKAREFLPEVVLCDIGLPDMDGFEVARRFRAEATLARVHLVALSGYALPEDVRRAQEAGFDRHLAKPPSLEKLQQILASLPPRARE